MTLKSCLAFALTLSLSVSALALTPSQAEARGTLKGGVVVTEDASKNPTVNPDDIQEVEPGTRLDMQVTTPLMSGLTIEGDEFFSRITQDYMVDGKVVIPKGTVVHGIVNQMEGPKRAGRNGYITTEFDYMITPDGREIPIEGKHTTKDNALKAAAKVVGRSAGFTLAGGVVGSIMVLKYGGLAAVAASEGYALAGGAAVGGAVGLTASLLTKGKNAMIQPGAQIQVHLKEPLELPSMNMPDASDDNIVLDGLDVDVLGMRIQNDPFGQPNEMTLSLNLENRTRNTFSSFDIALEDEMGNQHFASPFGDTGMWFRKLKPNSRLQGNITFNVDDPTMQHYLVFYHQYTRKPLARMAITRAMEVTDKKKMKEIFKKAQR